MSTAVATTRAQQRVLDRMDVRDTGYSSPCWISNRATHSNGYTKIGDRGSTKLTHRYAYEAFVGPIPDGMQLDHLCRVRACCNPDHLEPVTCRENLLRGDTITAQQAARTHCPRGHAYEGDNIYRRPDGSNKRDCRRCRNTRGRR